jgi:hypothetical protein
MAAYKYNPSFEEMLSGKLDYAILVRNQCFIAWSRTKEGPARPDFLAASADLRDMLRIDAALRDAQGYRNNWGLTVLLTPRAIKLIRDAQP